MKNLMFAAALALAPVAHAAQTAPFHVQTEPAGAIVTVTYAGEQAITCQSPCDLLVPMTWRVVNKGFKLTVAKDGYVADTSSIAQPRLVSKFFYFRYEPDNITIPMHPVNWTH